MYIILIAALMAQIPNGISKKYSYQDFSGRSLLNAKNLDGLTIYKSSFAQEEPDTEVFPPDVKDLRLVCVNVDNVRIPAGVTVNNRGGECGSRRRYKVQNDGRDWEVDKDDKPAKLINEEAEAAADRSIDPADIPSDAAVSRRRAACIAKGEKNCAKVRLDPDDMKKAKIAERKAKGEN
jgi:hypothetical protein